MFDDIEVLGQASPPRISEQGIAYYRDQLAGYEAKQLAGRLTVYEAQAYTALKASVSAALAATGQSLSPPSDGRSPAQVLHDQRWGLSFAMDGRVALPEALTITIERDDAGEAPNPEAVAVQLAAIGLDYKKTIAEVQTLLDRAGSATKANKLSVHALVQMSVFSGHLARANAGRPK